MKNLIYKFAEWLFKRLYDEPTYEELESKCGRLEYIVEELQEKYGDETCYKY